MKLLKKRKNHFIFILILLILAGLLEGIVYLHYAELSQHPIVINSYLSVFPDYNSTGNWIHGRLGIGYNRWLLLLEHAVTLLIVFLLFRYLDAMGRFFKLSPHWLYLADAGIAAALYRLITRMRGSFTLDYLCIKGHVFDFPDLYIGAFIAGILIYFIPLLIAYYKYIREKVKGMNLIRRNIWELKFAYMFIRMAVSPEEKWQDEFNLWQ